MSLRALPLLTATALLGCATATSNAVQSAPPEACPNGVRIELNNDLAMPLEVHVGHGGVLDEGTVLGVVQARRTANFEAPGGASTTLRYYYWLPEGQKVLATRELSRYVQVRTYCLRPN
jgi:hypothetical protein